MNTQLADQLQACFTDADLEIVEPAELGLTLLTGSAEIPGLCGMCWVQPVTPS